MWFAAFLIISLIMLLASRTEPALFVQRTSAGALEPVRSGIAGIGEGVGGLFGALGEIDRLRAENDALRTELAGGGALLLGLDRRVAEATQMPVHIADDPLTCVVRGTGRVLEDLDTLERVLVSEQFTRAPR
jgi:hypothetical protein